MNSPLVHICWTNNLYNSRGININKKINLQSVMKLGRSSFELLWKADNQQTVTYHQERWIKKQSGNGLRYYQQEENLIISKVLMHTKIHELCLHVFHDTQTHLSPQKTETSKEECCTDVFYDRGTNSCCILVWWHRHTHLQMYTCVWWHRHKHLQLYMCVSWQRHKHLQMHTCVWWHRNTNFSSCIHVFDNREIQTSLVIYMCLMTERHKHLQMYACVWWQRHKHLLYTCVW